MAKLCPSCKMLLKPRGGQLRCNACGHTEAQPGRRPTQTADRSTFARGRPSRGTASGVHQVGLAPQEGAADVLQPTPPAWRPEQGGQRDEELGLFPHDTVRDGQRDFLRDVRMAVRRGKHLVVQAPTGIGKTAASLAPALEYAMENRKVVFFLTSRQSQHRIAIDTLRKIQNHRGARFTVVDLIGKMSMCLHPEVATIHPAQFPEFCAAHTRNRTCKFARDVQNDMIDSVGGTVLHVEELMGLAKDHQICPHKLAVHSAQDAQVVVADYNHLFSDLRQLSMERLGVGLEDIVLIVDEAHNLPDRIRMNHKHVVSDRLIDEVRLEAKRKGRGDIEADMEALHQTIRDLSKSKSSRGEIEQETRNGIALQIARMEASELAVTFDLVRNRLVEGRSLSDCIEALSELAGELRKDKEEVVHSEALHDALKDWDRFRAGAIRYLEWDDAGATKLTVSLLDPSIPAKLVFKGVHSAILMSGTQNPLEGARDLLGLEEERTKLKEYPSPFPPYNRQVIVHKGTSSLQRTRGDATYDEMARCIVETAHQARGNIAVFAPSYFLLQQVQDFAQKRGLLKPSIVEESGMSKAERDRVLDQLRGYRPKGGAVLWGVLGGSLSEGIDYNDNLLVTVLIIGLPLAPPDLEVKSSMGYLDKRLGPGKGKLYGYDTPAMNRVLQAMGRGIRSATDRCAIVLLDFRYERPPYRGFLPKEPAPVFAQDPVPMVKRFLEHHDL